MAFIDIKQRFRSNRLPGEAALVGDSLHIAELRQIFDPLKLSDTFKTDRPLVLLAFSNRSGSTHLGQLLASADDLYGFREDLNHQTVKKRVTEEDLPDLTAYLSHILKLGDKPGAGFGVKASAQQLRLVHMAGIDRAFTETRVVRIRRRDRTAQAVSFWMASETQQWTSRDTEKPVALDYDAPAIRKYLNAIQSAESALDLVLALLPYKVLNVEYEALCDYPDFIIRRVRHGLDLPPMENAPTGWPERQVSEQKTEFVARFRKELAQDWDLDPDGPEAG